MRRFLTIAVVILSLGAGAAPARSWAAAAVTVPAGGTVIDTDGDGLSDDDEVGIWRTDPHDPDTDGDGYPDGLEVENGYDPGQGLAARLERRIVIDTKKQELAFEVNGQAVLRYPVSTGKRGYATPKGTFAVEDKAPKAWSATYRLWMPYWLDFRGGKYGIHELPIWPNGYQEQATHLGTPVSHGCVRLGIGPAKQIYDLAPVGTPVLIQ